MGQYICPKFRSSSYSH